MKGNDHIKKQHDIDFQVTTKFGRKILVEINNDLASKVLIYQDFAKNRFKI